MSLPVAWMGFKFPSHPNLSRIPGFNGSAPGSPNLLQVSSHPTAGTAHYSLDRIPKFLEKMDSLKIRVCERITMSGSVFCELE